MNLTARMEVIKAAMELFKNMTPAQELACELHDYNCRQGEKCNFRYEVSWNAPEHRRWLEKASIALQFADSVTILNIIHATKDQG